MVEENKRDIRYKQVIESYFQSDDPKSSRYSFKNSLIRNLSKIIETFFEVVLYYFDKYSEEEFHRKMLEEDRKRKLVDKQTGQEFILRGFQFIDDFKKNHRMKFAASITVVKSQKHLFKYDEEKLYNISTKLLELKGWNVNDMEKETLRQTIRRLKNIIYHNRDTLIEL